MQDKKHRGQRWLGWGSTLLGVGLTLLGIVGGWAGCAEDRILEIEPVCGNGFREGDEDCDNSSAGCSDTCTAVTGYACADNICETVCGDGIVAGEETCDDTDNPDCNSACRLVGVRPGCDMTGYWIVRQTDFSVDDIFGGLLQTSSNWYIFELTQEGDAFEVVTSRICGIRVSGTVDVTLTPSGLERLMVSNPQGAGNMARPPRRGISREEEDGTCTFSMDRWYIVRGLEEESGVSPYLPDDFLAKPELDSLTPLPDVPDDQRTSDTPLTPEGAQDWDGDGRTGLSWVVTGLATGTRNTVQRDWFEYMSTAEFPVSSGGNEFVGVSLFDNEENILHADSGPLLAGSTPAPGLQGQVTFRYLGRSLDEAAVAEILAAPLGEATATDVETCAKVVETLPHLDSEDLGVEL
ncbi:MAG: DUF4215 domain-containing protein [Myxococcota bacterium]